MALIPLQISISGYNNKPATVFAAYDEDSDVLVISIEAAFRRERRDGCLVITNDTKISRDSLFTEDDLQDSIEAFFKMAGGVAFDGKSSRLTFDEKGQRANPSQAIEKDGIDTNGQKYRISENISCAQIAVFAACYYANSRTTAINDMLDMADELGSIDKDHWQIPLNIYEAFTI